MAGFSELVRDFDKIRDYMREFLLFGFKSRNDFTKKSARTYDNEKRRIESYLGDFMKWEYTKKGKAFFISLNAARIPMNPLYVAWKSKSFTSNDIMLHFYIIDNLKAEPMLSIGTLTDRICLQSGKDFDVQTVRIKCGEYVREGLLCAEKQGKSLYYRLSGAYFSNLTQVAPGLTDAVKYFQNAAPVGVVGSFILDQVQIRNDVFVFKHQYIAHTLEDEILLQLLTAINTGKQVVIKNQSCRSGVTTEHQCVPLKIFVSAVTGRRFVCVFNLRSERFFNYRISNIRSVTFEKDYEGFLRLQGKLEAQLGKVWSVGFGVPRCLEIVKMKLFIDEEKDSFVLERVIREGQNGRVERVEKNVYLYTKEVFDTNDMVPWIKTFTGRILSIEGTNECVIRRIYEDMDRMKEMYAEGGMI